MKKMKMNRNRLSYVISNDAMEVQVTAMSANVTADIKLGDKTVSPFWYAPWHSDGAKPTSNCEYSLRGNFFAFPFGLNKPKNGIEYPCHGFADNNGYILKQYQEEAGEHLMVLETEIEEDHCTVERHILLKDGENNIYQKSVVKGAEGCYPVGYHPTIDIPAERSSAIIDHTPFVEAWVSPTQIEDYTKNGYSILKAGAKIEDLHKVPTVYGPDADLTRQPFTNGFDDAYMLLCDQTVDFSWTTVSQPTRGYLYYQLKDPKVLCNAMYWTSYQGRYYEPWNGRVEGCIEVGAQNGYFFYGITECEDNPLSQRGFTTCTKFDGGEKTFNFIEGVAEIPADYEGTEDILNNGDGTITIIGKKGEKFTVKCDLSFLK